MSDSNIECPWTLVGDILTHCMKDLCGSGLYDSNQNKAMVILHGDVHIIVEWFKE